MTTQFSAAGLKVVSALPGDAWSDAYLAQAPGLGQLVLRTLKAEVSADPQRVARFLAGAKALSNLRHGAVVSVHGAGTTKDGKVYVVTDLVQGETLAMRAPLPLEQLIDVGVPLSDALGAAHALGLVHGALSPARVLLTDEGPRLDFALAPLLREETADAAGDIRTLAAMLQAHVEPGDDLEPFATTLRHALAGSPDARGLRDRLVSLRRRDDGQHRTALSQPGVHAEDEAHVESVEIVDPDLTGQSLGKYAIEKIIGEGAMGRVYLARHTRIGRQAAIKVLKAEHARSRELVQRFIQEATAVNAIKNDHIVEVYDFGEDLLPDGSSRVFCVMELLEGIALADEMWKAPLKVQRAVRITQQLARALGAAHKVGVVHRDIKPDNIFLSMKTDSSPRLSLDDYVKVLDFGVAKLLKQIGDLPKSATSAGIVIGTPEYMAPEQALGLGTDLRVDVYAVGLTLYEMLTGVQPFQADSFGKLVVEITSRAPPPLPQKSRSGELIPRGLADVVMKCLQKKADDRYASAEELAHALEPFSGRPTAVDVAPAESDSAAIAAMQPRPGRMLLVAGLLLALVGGEGYWALRPYQEPTAPTPPPPPPAVAPLPEQVVLEIQSSPSGARVSRTDTGEQVGVTPLEVKLDKAAGTVTLKFEHPGRQPLERAVSLAHHNSLTVDLSPAAPAPVEREQKAHGGSKKKAREGVADPSEK
ncbi:MAG: protein kinase [Archangiaceae bacterium]|nr:protein kinase [Archangiaceae bacterium]